MKVTVKRKKHPGTSYPAVSNRPRLHGKTEKNGICKMDRRAAIRINQTPRITRRGA